MLPYLYIRMQCDIIGTFCHSYTQKLNIIDFFFNFVCFWSKCVNSFVNSIFIGKNRGVRHMNTSFSSKNCMYLCVCLCVCLRVCVYVRFIDEEKKIKTTEYIYIYYIYKYILHIYIYIYILYILYIYILYIILYIYYIYLFI